MSNTGISKISEHQKIVCKKFQPLRILTTSSKNFTQYQIQKFKFLKLPDQSRMIFLISHRYDGLAVKNFIEWADIWHPVIFEYLPHRKLELPKTPKQWVANVLATVLKDSFKKWVDEQVEKRHARVAKERDLMINMDPVMAKVFKESTAVSSKYHSELRIR